MKKLRKLNKALQCLPRILCTKLQNTAHKISPVEIRKAVNNAVSHGISTMSALLKANLDFIADQVKLKHEVLEFLQSTGCIEELKQSCFYFQQKLQSECQQQTEPFVVILKFSFNDINTG